MRRGVGRRGRIGRKGGAGIRYKWGVLEGVDEAMKGVEDVLIHNMVVMAIDRCIRINCTDLINPMEHHNPNSIDLHNNIGRFHTYLN